MSTLHTRNLASAFLAGPWTADGLRQRGESACGRSGRWLTRLVARLLRRFPEPSRIPMGGLAAFLEADQGFERAQGEYGLIRHLETSLCCDSPVMAPGPVAEHWAVPSLATPGALAEWLGLTVSELDWFADRRGLNRKCPAGALPHYTYRWLERRHGRPRLLEVPKPQLKAIQRGLLRDLLDRIPAHEAAHGYRPGRSVRTCALPHCGQRVVMRLDLRDFFASVRASRVFALFRTAGYPENAARLLASLCTNVVPDEVLRSAPSTVPDRYDAFRVRHLPQGAPTSPALANLCAYRLDCRLAGLAARLDAVYTRYADDLTFSGGEQLERSVRRLHVLVCRIALEEGFEVNTRKTRVMRRSVRQSVLGVVVNERPGVSRAEYDELKAILYNCVRHGPATQNRAGHADFRAHLLGRISHVVHLNSPHGARLLELFDRIHW